VTFDEYVAASEAEFRASENERRGQVYWYHLYVRRPDLAKLSTVVGLDPFYDDDLLEAFLQEVAYAW